MKQTKESLKLITLTRKHGYKSNYIFSFCTISISIKNTIFLLHLKNTKIRLHIPIYRVYANLMYFTGCCSFLFSDRWIFFYKETITLSIIGGNLALSKELM